MKALSLLSLLALSGCAAAASAERAPEPRDPTRVEWRLHIDTKDKGIGAYTILIHWNPDVASIEEIVPCSPRYFSGTPNYLRDTFTTGTTRITAFDTSGTKPRSGQWHLFTVIFRQVAPGTLTAKAELEKLYDDANKPFTGRLMDGELKHTFP